MLFPAWLINIHSIPCGSKGNFGFFYKLNWSLMYTIILPLIYALIIWLSDRIKESVFDLCDAKLQVINPKISGFTPDYPQAVSNRLESLAGLTILLSLMLTIIISVADTWDLWWGFYDHHTFPCSVKPDWDTPFTGFNCDFYEKNCASYLGPCQSIQCDGYIPPTKTANFLFDLIPYLFQGIAIFLAFFWVGKFWSFLQIFSNQLSLKDSPYKFDPMVSDKRLGLRPMSKIFNGFLLVTVLFQAYIFYHRLQLIALFRQNSSTITYVHDVVRHLGSSDLFFELKYYAFDGVDTSTWILLSFMTVPIIVICYVPLWSLRKYVIRRRDALWRENARRRDEALRENKYREAEEYENKINALNGAEVWPNGDATARRFLIVMTVLGISSLLPQMFFYLSLIGLLVEFAFTFLRKPSQVMIKRTEEIYQGDVFKNINNAIIATRGSIIMGVNALHQQGQNDVAKAISALERIIAGTADDELPPEKKVKSAELLRGILEESAKPQPSKSMLKVLGDALWNEVINLKPIIDRGNDLWPTIAKLWLQ
jgi:hypothetical protein